MFPVSRIHHWKLYPLYKNLNPTIVLLVYNKNNSIVLPNDANKSDVFARKQSIYKYNLLL